MGRFLLRVAIAAVIAVAVTVVPAFGYSSVLQMVAQWTAEQFDFRSVGALPADQVGGGQNVPEEYAEFQAVLRENGIESLTVPQYIPDGFRVEEEPLHISPITSAVEFTLQYEKENAYIRACLKNKYCTSRV